MNSKNPAPLAAFLYINTVNTLTLSPVSKKKEEDLHFRY